MKKRQLLPLLVALILLIGPMACSVKEVVQTQALPTLFSLNGQWVVTNDSKTMDEVMFDFREKAGDLELRVWGKTAKLDGIRKNDHQFIFSYSVDNNRSYSVLATVLGRDKIKLSRVEDSIHEFQPLGKLGEKVYHLQKRNQGDLKLVTKVLKD